MLMLVNQVLDHTIEAVAQAAVAAMATAHQLAAVEAMAKAVAAVAMAIVHHQAEVMAVVQVLATVKAVVTAADIMPEAIDQEVTAIQAVIHLPTADVDLLKMVLASLVTTANSTLI